MVRMRTRWRFRKDDVGVCAAESERVYAGQSFAIRFRKRLERRWNAQLQFFEIDVWIRGSEMQTRGNLPVLENEHGLHQAGDARCRFEMAHVCFHRANRQGLGAILTERLRERMRFDRVTDGCTGS